MIRIYFLFLIVLMSCNGKDGPKEIEFESEKDSSQIARLEIARQQFQDTLNSVIGLENLKNIIDKEENEKLELFRLLKATGAFGKNDLQIIELRRKEEKIILKKYILGFNLKCNTPFVEFIDGIEFSKDCFKLRESTSISIKLEKWNDIKQLMQDTDFLEITYIQRGKTMCDGHSYFIEYIYPFHWGKEIISLEKPCPGKKAAIYLLGEELIKFGNEI